jgi:hypothetical protein
VSKPKVIEIHDYSTRAKVEDVVAPIAKMLRHFTWEEQRRIVAAVLSLSQNVTVRHDRIEASS